MNRRLRFRRSPDHPAGRFQLYIEPRDLRIGAYRGPDAWYLIALPTVVLCIATRPEALVACPEPGKPDPLDYAMFEVWLNGNWRWLTGCMTRDAKEAAVAAVLRHDQWMNRDEPEENRLTRGDLAWWDA